MTNKLKWWKNKKIDKKEINERTYCFEDESEKLRWNEKKKKIIKLTYYFESFRLIIRLDSATVKIEKKPEHTISIYKVFSFLCIFFSSIKQWKESEPKKYTQAKPCKLIDGNAMK